MLKVKFKTGAEAEAFSAALFLARNVDRDNNLEQKDTGRFSVHDMVLEKGTEKPYTVLVIDNEQVDDKPAAYADLVDLDYLPTQPDWHV